VPEQARLLDYLRHYQLWRRLWTEVRNLLKSSQLHFLDQKRYQELGRFAEYKLYFSKRVQLLMNQSTEVTEPVEDASQEDETPDDDESVISHSVMFVPTPTKMYYFGKKYLLYFVSF
jgi:hypothetical protein